MKRDPQVSYRDKSLISEPSVGHPGLGCQGPCKMPISFPTNAGEDGVFLASTQAKKVPNSCTRLAPLFPITHAHPSPDPSIQFRDGTVIFTNSIVPHPAPNIGRDLIQSVGHRDPPATTRKPFKFAFECCKAFLGPTDCLPRKGEAQEGALP